MDEIDKPFRPKWDFFLVWVTLATPVFIFRDKFNQGLPWYSVVSFVVVVPFILTFFIYGPVLFLRQVIKSGERGWFWLRCVLVVFMPSVLGCGLLLVAGQDKVANVVVWPLLFLGIALSFLLPDKYGRNN